MEKSFILEGITSEEMAARILENVKKMVGVEDANLSASDGKLYLLLARENKLIGKLLKYVVEKESKDIVIIEEPA